MRCQLDSFYYWTLGFCISLTQSCWVLSTTFINLELTIKIIYNWLQYSRHCRSKMWMDYCEDPARTFSLNLPWHANEKNQAMQIYRQKNPGQHKSIQVCLHFNWCAPAGKIESMHLQCRSPKGTLHCINVSKKFKLTTLVSVWPRKLISGSSQKSRDDFTNHRFLAPNVTNNHILNINCPVL